jgi:hypothetical protein
MNKNYLLVGLLALPVVGMGIKLSMPSSHASNSPRALAGQSVTAGDDETANLKKELEQLRAEVGSLANRQSALSVRVQPAPTASGAPREPTAEQQPSAGVESAEVIQERQKQAALHKIETMARKFSTEPVDREWATGAANDLRDKVNLTGGRVEDVQCATTLCRFTISSTSGDQTMQAVDEALKQRPWEGEAFFSFDENEPGKASVYLTRVGSPLPKFD